jgi:hypothetical protein
MVTPVTGESKKRVSSGRRSLLLRMRQPLRTKEVEEESPRVSRVSSADVCRTISPPPLVTRNAVLSKLASPACREPFAAEAPAPETGARRVLTAEAAGLAGVAVRDGTGIGGTGAPLACPSAATAADASSARAHRIRIR